MLCSSILIGGSYNLYIRFSHIDTVEGNYYWHDSNNHPYVIISASTPFNQGYLAGEAMSGEILQMKWILKIMCPSLDLSYNSMKKFASTYIPYIPDRYIEEMEGIAEGVSHHTGIKLTFEDILIQNTWMDILYGQIIPGQELDVGCTAIGGKNLAGFPVLGQNFDFTKIFYKTTSFVFLNFSNSNHIFGLRLGASLALPIAKTSTNVTVLSTLVRIGLQSSINIPFMIKIRQILDTVKNASDFQTKYFSHSYKSTFGHTLMWADNSSLCAAEVFPKVYRLNTSQILVQTNRYHNETWNQNMLDPEYSLHRQQYAEEQTERCLFGSCASSDLLFNVLGDSPEIYRKDAGLMDSMTMLYFTNTHFGYGQADMNTAGYIPV